MNRVSSKNERESNTLNNKVSGSFALCDNLNLLNIFEIKVNRLA